MMARPCMCGWCVSDFEKMEVAEESFGVGPRLPYKASTES